MPVKKDGMVRFTYDPANPSRLTPKQEAFVDSLTDEQLTANALADPDNPPITEAEFRRGLMGRRIRLLRGKLGLSQTEFAERYGIPVANIRQYEIGRTLPPPAVRAYLTVIEKEPEVIARALRGAA